MKVFVWVCKFELNCLSLTQHAEKRFCQRTLAQTQQSRILELIDALNIIGYLKTHA